MFVSLKNTQFFSFPSGKKEAAPYPEQLYPLRLPGELMKETNKKKPNKA